MQFANSVLEDEGHWPVNECVHNASHCEDASDNCTNVSQELKYVLLVLVELDCDGWQLVVEKQHVLISTEIMLEEGG